MEVEKPDPEEIRARRIHLQGVLRDTKKMKTIARRAGLVGTPQWAEVNACIRNLELKLKELR